MMLEKDYTNPFKLWQQEWILACSIRKRLVGFITACGILDLVLQHQSLQHSSPWFFRVFTLGFATSKVLIANCSKLTSTPSTCDALRSFFRIFPCQFACFEKSDLEKKCTSLTCFLFILHVRCINPVWLFSEKAEFRCLIDFLDFFGTSQNQGEYHKITDNLVICGFSWVSILEGQITQNKSKDNHHAQCKPPKGKKTAQSPSPFSSQCLKPHLPDVFFQQLPTLNHHALRPESRYISPNCFQSLPLHPCHGPTDVPSAYREQRNMCMYIQMCIYNVCVGVSQNYGFS